MCRSGAAWRLGPGMTMGGKNHYPHSESNDDPEGKEGDEQEEGEQQRKVIPRGGGVRPPR